MNIGEVSTPGAYLAGKSVYACEDLSGNAWEWTRSQQGSYPYPQSDSLQWQQREAEDGDARRAAAIPGLPSQLCWFSCVSVCPHFL
jgi:formylglycine-generating enzyme required for sulfatase activity